MGSSAAWGESTGACFGLGYLRAPDGAVINADWINAGSYEVNVGGVLYPITVSLKPIHDPANERLRS
ncbi:MAG TPA: glycine cleavage T C-terminal barrel domain-containing protein [Mycobacterium sp.]|nr:glycine cleavage T C-terminal barrel domain-containing protein [Mycobacterium sp.]HQC75586.1 glycine cleavage T C-terminal barrel domain-containing protein [Mycobacterium sp.]